MPISSKKLKNLEYLRFSKKSREYKYLVTQREKLGGFLPKREAKKAYLKVADYSHFDEFSRESKREMSTTMVFVRLITSLLRDKKIGKNIVPIVPDEARTFGMDGLFRQFGIYSREGQKYQPEDADKVMWYRCLLYTSPSPRDTG